MGFSMMNPDDPKTNENDPFDIDSVQVEPEMTVLDVIHRYRNTAAVFRRYDEAAGECICCKSLFETLSDVSKKYGIDLEQLIVDLRQSAR